VAARLGRLQVSGLRCLHGLDLGFDELTALIGANGAGKSSTVRAVQFLFGQVELDADDVTDRLADPEVVVSGVFTDLPADWSERLGPWLNDDGDLEIARSWSVGGDGKPRTAWTCERRQASGVGAVRAALASGAPAADLKAAYAAARESSGDALPAYQNKSEVAAALNAYEHDHPEALTERSTDQGLRFGPGVEHDLNTMLELLVLPAMRDAADDAGDSRGSTLARLVEITVRSEMNLDADLEELSKKTTTAYQKLLDERGTSRLNDLSVNITRQLASFAPGASVTLSFDTKIASLSVPGVRARIVESGHTAEIGRQGHGVQRAYVFSLLRALLDARRGDGDVRPGLLLVVEEPEVYQHPVRARYVARVLADLARDTDQSTQVVYTTHSPYFVSVDNIPAVRLLRLTPCTTETGERSWTRASAASLDEIAARLDQARAGTGQTWIPERVAAQLPGLLGSTVSEGLFADAVVLVEGEEDIGLVDGAAAAAGVDLAALGVAVVSVGGKDPLPLASEVFRALGVPLYVVFDTDEKPDGQATDPGGLRLNAMLTWLADGTASERPGTTVGPRWAAGSPTLRAALDADAGAAQVRDKYAETAREMGLPESTCKNGHLVRTAVTRLYDLGLRSETLDKIVEAVCALVARPSADGSADAAAVLSEEADSV
jgi:putative ATP-dependent endonuclease of OLD family